MLYFNIETEKKDNKNIKKQQKQLKNVEADTFANYIELTCKSP